MNESYDQDLENDNSAKTWCVIEWRGYYPEDGLISVHGPLYSEVDANACAISLNGNGDVCDLESWPKS